MSIENNVETIFELHFGVHVCWCIEGFGVYVLCIFIMSACLIILLILLHISMYNFIFNMYKLEY